MDATTASEEVAGLSESELREAVAVANIPTLLMVIFHVTGERKWLEPPYRPTRGKGLGDHDSGGLPEDVQAEVRSAAVEALMRLAAGDPPAIGVPSPELMVEMMSTFMGESIPDGYGPMLSAEFARRTGLGQPADEPARVTPPPGFTVLVVGAGVAGIAAAFELQKMGIEYRIVEKQPVFGGNWWQNTYPGAGVDTPSHLYSFSFATNDWGKHFELRDEIHSYIAAVARDIGADQWTQFETEVTVAEYDEAAHRWRVQLRRSDGTIETIVVNAIVSAVGVLNRPKLPGIATDNDFRGASFHSAAWPKDLSLSGKRVAVIGTGASSMQIVPAIVDSVESLVILQRTPQWVAPFEKFATKIPTPLRALLATNALFRGWYWLRLFWQFGDKVIEALQRDPGWPHPERSVNSRNDGHRRFFTEYIKTQLGDRPDLLPKVVPTYPPFGKRILLDNGWYRALRKENVELVADSVASVTEHGVVTSSGAEYDADVLVWATGFDAARFVASMDIRGVGGVTLRDAWDDDNPRAYLGIAVPGFPNFFMLGGPNSFPGSGSFMFHMEVQMRYVRKLLTEMFEKNFTALEVREEAAARYTDMVDSRHADMVWTHPGVQTYYRNPRGRVVFVMPFLNLEYWDMVRDVNLNDYSTNSLSSRSAGGFCSQAEIGRTSLDPQT